MVRIAKNEHWVIVSKLQLDKLTALQLWSSIMALLWTVSALSVELPVYLGGIVRAVRRNSFKDYAKTFNFNMFIVTPKLIALAAAFSNVDSTRWMDGLYLILFWLLAYVWCLSNAMILNALTKWARQN